MDSDINSQYDFGYSETFCSEEVECANANRFRQYELFNTHLYGEPASEIISDRVLSESELWKDAFPHLRIVGKNIFPISNIPNCEPSEDAYEEIFAEQYDDQDAHEINSDISVITQIERGRNVPGEEDNTSESQSSVDLLTGRTQEEFVTRSSYQFPSQNLRHQRNVSTGDWNRETLPDARLNRSSGQASSSSWLPKPKKSKKRIQTTLKSTDIHGSRFTNKSNDSLETDFDNILTLSPLEIKHDVFPTRLSSKARSNIQTINRYRNISVHEDARVVSPGMGLGARLSPIATSSIKGNLGHESPALSSRSYVSSPSLNHFNKIPPIPSSKSTFAK